MRRFFRNKLYAFAKFISKQVREDIRSELMIQKYDRLSCECMERGITDDLYYGQRVIVSMTTHSKRIYKVYLAIESLLQQTVKPNKIILWLANDEFDDENIPEKLRRLKKRGLEIEYYKDIRQYKKIIPVLEKYPEDIIITVDDDVIYQDDLVENLMNSYKKDPQSIHFCRGHRMKLDETGKLLKYKDWQHRIAYEGTDILNFPTGVGGVLYPPHSLHTDVTRADLFMNLAPTSDDIWLKGMAILQGSSAKKAYTHSPNGVDYHSINPDEPEDDIALFHINVSGGKNDEQIEALFRYYDISL